MYFEKIDVLFLHYILFVCFVVPVIDWCEFVF